MIYEFVVFLLCIALGGIMWYVCNEVVTGTMDSLALTWPAYFGGDWFTFLESWWWYLPLLAILLPALFWIIVHSQRNRTPELIESV